jgi:hypothetical protein
MSDLKLSDMLYGFTSGMHEKALALEATLEEAEVARLKNENSLMAAHQGIDNHQRLLDRITGLEAEVARLTELTKPTAANHWHDKYQEASTRIAELEARLAEAEKPHGNASIRYAVGLEATIAAQAEELRKLRENAALIAYLNEAGKIRELEKQLETSRASASLYQGLLEGPTGALAREAAQKEEINELRRYRCEQDCRYTMGGVADSGGIYCLKPLRCARCREDAQEKRIHKLREGVRQIMGSHVPLTTAHRFCNELLISTEEK